MRAWVNGQLLEDPSAPAVTVSDHGLTVGDGVFEAVKIVDDRPFALTLHLERLKRSAAGLGLPEHDEGLVRKGVEAVLAGGGLALWRFARRRARSAAQGKDAPLKLSAEEEARLTRLLATHPSLHPREPRV